MLLTPIVNEKGYRNPITPEIDNISAAKMLTFYRIMISRDSGEQLKFIFTIHYGH